MLASQFLIVVAFLALAFAAPPIRDPSRFHPSNRRRLPIPLLENWDDSPVLQYIELPLNHFGNSSQTFLNRYWVDDHYYKPGGPVFFYDVGEASAEDYADLIRLGAGGDIAKEFNGLLITWEHRFYGTSMPNMTSDMQFRPDQLAEYLRFQTVEQALEDIVVFARAFSFPRLSGVDLRPGNTPWVFLGGSYPGARSAWARQRNPEIFHASLASSSCVQQKLGVWEYYLPAERTIPASGYANCSEDIKAAARYIDDLLERKETMLLDQFMANVTGPTGSLVYRYFHQMDTTDPALVDDRRLSLLMVMMDIFRDFQYVGMVGDLENFCNTLQFTAHGDAPELISGSIGVFAENKARPELAVGMYSHTLWKFWEQKIYEDQLPVPSPLVSHTNRSGAGDYAYDCAGIDREDCQTLMTALSWGWQLCSELGGFVTMKKGRPENLLPYNLMTSEIQMGDCIEFFGSAVMDGPDFEPLNKRYGGWNMTTSNVLWVDGELDPWRAITPGSMTDDSPKRPNTQVVPKSGEVLTGGTYFGMVVEGAFHCPDLGYDWSERGLEAHELFKSALMTWLPAFVKHSL